MAQKDNLQEMKNLKDLLLALRLRDQMFLPVSHSHVPGKQTTC